MSDLFDNIKKNIITNMTPLQNALKTQANFLIDTFLEDNMIQDRYSDDFEDDSDDNTTDSENLYNNTYDDYDNNPYNKINDYSNTNIVNYKNYKNYKNYNTSEQLDAKNLKIRNIPKQQKFNDNSDKLKINVYSPIACSDNSIDEGNTLNVELVNNENIDVIDQKSIENTIIHCVDDVKNNVPENNIDNNCTVKYVLLNNELLIKNLTTLTKIEKNQKLNIVYDDTINNKLNFEINIDESYFPQFSRWYYNQNRNCTIDTINSLIDFVLEQYNYYKLIGAEEYIQKYSELLNKTNDGLSNLKITYDNDSESIDKINKIMRKIRTIIDEQNTTNN